MKKKIYNPKCLELTEGFFSDRVYNSYEMMSESTKNWQQLCPYQLTPNGLSGRHKTLHLSNIQIVYATRHGGTMHSAGSAKDSLTIAIVQECTDKACFGKLKLQTGDILFFDDSNPYNFITNDTIKFIAVSINRDNLGLYQSILLKAINHTIKDSNTLFLRTLQNIWKRSTDPTLPDNNKAYYKDAEKEILDTIIGLLSKQTPTKSKLTRGEKIALDIRDQVIQHMDGNISISSLAEQYNISEQTLQNGFKSLFGFTPKLFLRQLKLNIVRQELLKSDYSTSTISKISLKWGFFHMGRFSYYYTKLFGENPSVTLKKTHINKNNLKESCVLRQEEI